MSARTLSLWLLALVLPILIIIKPIQMFFEPGVEGGSMFRIGLGFLRRSDDPSLWSFVTALAATIAVYYGTRSNTTAKPGDNRPVRTTAFSWSVTLVVYVIAIFVYVLNVRDHGGTFFWAANKGQLTPSQMVIEDLQDFEGFTSVLAMFVPYFYLGLAAQMLKDYFNDPERTIPLTAHRIALAGVLPFYSVAAYCLWYGAFLALGKISPDAAEAIDTFKYQKLPAVLATQLLFWTPLIAVCAVATFFWRRDIRWKLVEVGPFPIFPMPSYRKADKPSQDTAQHSPALT